MSMRGRLARLVDGIVAVRIGAGAEEHGAALRDFLNGLPDDDFLALLAAPPGERPTRWSFTLWDRLEQLLDAQAETRALTPGGQRLAGYLAALSAEEWAELEYAPAGLAFALESRMAADGYRP